MSSLLPVWQNGNSDDAMFLFDWFRSFLPLHNPLGFGVADFLEFAAALLGVALWLLRARFQAAARRFAERTLWCMLLLAALPVVLRLALLWRFPVPTPSFSDDFGYLFLADTLRHFRFANPTHPLHQFFEAVFILQEPTFSSSFPLGQGLVLAIGWTLFGHPWAGVLLTMGLLSALCYWMLRGWTTPGWALVGGTLAACTFGPLCQWMNLYWGGALSAVAGCLIFGALPRLRERWQTRDAVLLGLGLGLQMLTRPYEFVMVAVAVALFFIRADWRRVMRAAAIAGLAFLPAVLLMLVQNRQVTGSFTTLPYQESRFQYAIPAAFTFQPNLEPHRGLTAEEELDYRAQALVHDEAVAMGFWGRLLYRLRFYRFFFLAPLYLILPAFLLALREWRYRWVAGTILLLALGSNLYPYFYPHYIAAASCLFVLVAITAAERLCRFERWKPLPYGRGSEPELRASESELRASEPELRASESELRASEPELRASASGSGIAAVMPLAPIARIALGLCAFQFLFWYGIYLLGNEKMLLSAVRYQSSDFINYGDLEGRIAINRRLEKSPGQQLVFVRYSPQHMFHEWIQNAADPDAARVVWAADLGAEENKKLLAYYPNRKAWLVEPDARPPLMMPYELAPPGRD